jgi:hypothetical protein
MIPGRLLHRVAAALCSADMRERALDAFIADCQHEWNAAATRFQRLSALARCWSSFWITLAGCLAHDVRHDFAGVSKRILAPLSWGGFWCAVILLIAGGREWVRMGALDPAELRHNLTLMSAYLPAVLIACYRNRKCTHRSWSGLAWSLALMCAFLIFRGLFSEFRFILGWAAGSCVTASWTFLVKKAPSVVEASN